MQMKYAIIIDNCEGQNISEIQLQIEYCNSAPLAKRPGPLSVRTWPRDKGAELAYTTSVLALIIRIAMHCIECNARMSAHMDNVHSTCVHTLELCTAEVAVQKPTGRAAQCEAPS